MREHTLIEAIRKAAREEQIAEFRIRIDETADHKAMAEEFFQRIVEQNQAISSRHAEIAALRDQAASLRVALQWKDAGEAVQPVEETPPSTVEEAVLNALDRFSDRLVFGEDVNRGIGTVAPDAGPPDKILSYLEALADLTDARRSGPLGDSVVGWLETRGVSPSRESLTIRNSPTEMQARTWDNGTGERQKFELHLKPSDATAPDRCVRIYFDFNEARQMTIVGWWDVIRSRRS